MSNVLEQAQEAFRQENWSLLTHCLQQLLSKAPAHVPATVDHNPLLPTAAEMVVLLELAIAALEAGDFQDRWEIAKLLPIFGDRAIAPLITLLQDDTADLEARWFAARILSGYSHPDVIRALMDLLQTTDSEELSSMAAESLANLGTTAIAALTNLLAIDDTRLFAVRSLAHIRRSETIAPLLTVVRDPNPAVRAITIEALGSFHDSRVPPVLVNALHDENATVRQVAVEALGFRHDLTLPLALVTLLSPRLRDTNAAVCQQAAIALGRLGTDAAAEALFAVLKSPQTPLPLQIEVVWALTRIGSAIALDYLRQALPLLQEPAAQPLCQALITAVGQWEVAETKPQAAQLLMATLATPLVVDQPTLRQAIALGLGQLEQPDALETLMQLLADEAMGVRLHAIAALKALDAQTARQRLEQLAHSDLPEPLRQGVAIALREW
ncbi:HEAT repeat domain-containing protein [Leptolyngbya sp. FACHB-321]|uniref:HEAT repeat domain-containing protein n=1 Tax=Leptolyngbya sp. FACHB-321 TaxID=2692807 RepID=UPI00168948A0|nr:HEAT repeat domain-containing protein [Leptolyngbya sp. FACHB-321]MBD2038520.1 HEAT repeat domain-containing protein [Leptolyngbya sp. FACHB-321]